MTNIPARCILIVVLIANALLFFSCKKTSSVFTDVSASKSNIHFANNLEKRKFFNILYYLYYYNGGGVATGDINNDGLVDIYFAANSKGNNKLYLNKGDFEFEDVTKSAGVAGNSDWCTGVAMADVNGDGLLDIYVSAVSNSYELKGHNELYINKGNGKFTESAAQYGLDFRGLSTQAAFFDYDRDGDLDCYVLRHSKQPHQNIVDTVNRRKVDSLSGDKLLRNDGSRFIDVSSEAGIYQSNLGYGLGLAIADMNNDGWDDIYVGNDFHENDYYYINNGDGSFTESGAKHFRHYSRFSMGNDVADYNNDAQPDVITVDMLPPDEKTLKTYGSDENPDVYKVKLEINGYQHQYSKNCLQRNNGDGISFSEIGLMSGVSATDWSWAPLFADFDNDGRKDLFVSSGIVKRPVDLDYVRFVTDMDRKQGRNRTEKNDDITIDNMPDGSSHPYFFKGNVSGKFEDVSVKWGTGKMKGYFNGAAYADLDNDGDLDMVINSINSKASILRNNTTGKKFLSVSFKGENGNRYGLGTKAYLFYKGGMQYQQLSLTRGFQSSVEPRLSFGLDTIAVVDSLLIVWPDQRYQVLKQLPANQFLNVLQKNATGKFDYKVMIKKDNDAPDSLSYFMNARVFNEWRHEENDFFDYNVQYLIPHAQSTRGPKLAVADVNKDGLDDFYACGARDQPGSLMIQQPGGSFMPTNLELFKADSICEDVDAVFFDADNDGDPDLYVVSGGNEVPRNSMAAEDRLYLNDGRGNFSKAKSAFTQQYENKSCVTVADIDKDGDMDFFVGNLASPTGYGLLRDSYLYINDGKANFKLAGSNIISLKAPGMVTSSTFTDINNDTWPDLVITGEWMPVKIFINNKGVLQASDIPASTGLWQTIYTRDVNGDGFTDILAGNWGHNSKLYAGKESPLKLYVKDFDHNGSTEQIMAYRIGGAEYTFLAKDELERSLPVLKKAYLKYSEVAGKTVQHMFYDLFTDYREFKAETLSSSLFLNDGKGNFRRMDLPDELQLAPVMSFVECKDVNGSTFLAAGNFYGVIPYEGRYDALLPTRFGMNKNGDGFYIRENFPGINGEIRDAEWLNGAGGKKLLILAFNNRAPLIMEKR